MSELLDARPGGLDAFYRPGDPLTVELTWPTGTLAGRTFTSTLGAATLGVAVVGDVMTITATPAQTAAAGEVAEWELVDTTAADDVTVLVGRWAASDGAASTHEATVTVSAATGEAVVIIGAALDPNLPLVFWQHPVAVTYPSGTNLWTPVPFNSLFTTVGQVSDWTSYVPAATTIAAGSNGAVLPQGTINVASTTGFAAAGYLVVRISGTDRVIAYTGKTATTFTGCTLGVGTLATGQAIAQANVAWTVPHLAGPTRVGPAIAEVAFAQNPNGDRGLRFRQNEGFQFFAGTKTERACINNVHHVQTCEQPATGLLRVEAMQDSGGLLDGVVDQLAAPRLVVQALSGIAP